MYMLLGPQQKFAVVKGLVDHAEPPRDRGTVTTRCADKPMPNQWSFAAPEEVMRATR